jgi:chromosome segregation ATPase
MSDYSNPFETKPIEKVKNEVHQINQNINKMKTDLISIRADISIIKDYIKKKEEENKEISTGWFWS